jgi:hypothetical protein
VENESSVSDVINDLREFGRGSWEPDDIPDEVVRYLLLNYFAIEQLVHIVFKTFSAEQRKALATEHRELDQSVIGDNFQPIALSALEKLTSHFMMKAEITQDDMNMLIRALEYAKYTNLVIPNLFRDP